jgi:hypothetical protein
MIPMVLSKRLPILELGGIVLEKEDILFVGVLGIVAGFHLPVEVEIFLAPVVLI